MLDIQAVQQQLQSRKMDGWLLYDFRNSNPLARRVLHMPEHSMGTRRLFYWIPVAGAPRKLVHRIESGALDHLPGEKVVYLKWQELESGVKQLVTGAHRVAMEYSPRNANPYVSRVDAGTVELVTSFGPEVVSSADLIQQFEATWDAEQWEMHLEASRLTDGAFSHAWQFVTETVLREGEVLETAVQKVILDYFRDHQLVTDHGPIVAVGPHSGDPHFETSPERDLPIRRGDLLLIDLWAKLDRPRAVFSDLTRMAVVDHAVADHYAAIFDIVRRARDAAVEAVRQAFAAGQRIRGWQVDQAARDVIEEAGYGDYFFHRTGHSIGRETHGNGANMDNLEMHDEREVLPNTCFSVEPGIYFAEFGMRSEIDVFVDGNGTVHVTGGEPQQAIRPLLTDR